MSVVGVSDNRNLFLETIKQWGRPVINEKEVNSDLNFFVTDADSTQMSVPDHLKKNFKPSQANSDVPVIQLFGCTREGHSVKANVFGFWPYFYCEAPPEGDAFGLKDVLIKNNQDATDVEVTEVFKKSLMHYRGNEKSRFFKIQSNSQSQGGLRRAIEKIGVQIDGLHRGTVPSQLYEARVPPELRFMIDRGLDGCTWIKASEGTFKVLSESSKTSRCQIEFNIMQEDLHPYPPDGPWMDIAPFRILSYDIECVKLNDKGFPVSHLDPVIQISSILQLQGKQDFEFKALFSLHKCAPIPDATVFWFSDEKEMLEAWRDFIVEVDPDILTGYNCVNFDMNYLITRADTLGSTKFGYLGRLKKFPSKIRNAQFQSRALGQHDYKDINIDGRIHLDVLDIVRREYKLKAYSLNYVSSHFLKEQKEDIQYSMISVLFKGSEENRQRIGVYCIKDSILPLRLISKLLLIVNQVEMGRVTGTPINYLLTRGQQIKVVSQILRKAQTLGYLIPTSESRGGGGDKYEGATVLEPQTGFYREPIVTLDFASLYPSIMMAHNLCYCTLIPVGDPIEQRLKPEEIETTPTGDRFVKKSVVEGVLPMIVRDLITARKKAKRQMAETDDEMTKRVLNGRQLALKISANSVYGFTGAASGGQLPCLEISTSITSYGRDMIDFTKARVESIFLKANGYQSDATVVYGDTDSVMINFHVDTVEAAMKLGTEAAERISKEFQDPIKLEFEKVFKPFLLMAKKRYAGLLWTQPENYDKIDYKGIETVRRDFCLLVQQLCDTVLKKILLDEDLEGAQEFTKNTIRDLLNKRVDMSLLVMSKSLSKENYTGKQGHVELAAKLKQRDPANAPAVGDRVHYVVVSGNKGQPQYDRCEDPVYVLENDLSVDVDHYLAHIQKPIERIFEGVLKEDDLKGLFQGDHVRVKSMSTGSMGGMAKFVKKVQRCLSCRAIVHGGGALCTHCKLNKQKEVIFLKAESLQAEEKQFNSLWVQCQRCQGSLHDDILCTSRDCPIFYRRIKIQKDLKQSQKHWELLTKSDGSWDMDES
eukprot:GHVP01059411.1.p1 GENE.GHVP01059411.1~~GHVP01059411.1.p1  ORF type:complete len:1059 (+),score=189.46 GHVP01059411.1:43-3177(+)